MKKYDGFVIAIAWPEYVGKQTGAWYDTPMRWLGFNKNFHYQVGHAALVLVNKSNGECHYFDCGRFHAPYQCGRIRDVQTDADLAIKRKAKIENNKIENFTEILEEVQKNPSFLGQGKLYASYCEVDYDAVKNRVKNIQCRGAISFGPFVLNGTNCCRFVRGGILAGNPSWRYRLPLKYFWVFKPMPITIYNFLSDKTTISAIDGREPNSDAHHSIHWYNSENVHGTLPAPPRPSGVPPEVQWLAGEVSGSWFYLEKYGDKYAIWRFSPSGKVECKGLFEELTTISLNIEKPFYFTHISNCQEVIVRQENRECIFRKIVSEKQNTVAVEKLISQGYQR